MRTQDLGSDGLHRSDRWHVSSPSSCFSTHICTRLSHVYLDQILDSKLHRLSVEAIGSVLGGTSLTGAPHRSDPCGP
jgi:hypothetical protein